MTTKECLEAAARIEVLVQTIYGGLASRYADQAELRDLFLRLAAEEEQHAYRIRTLARHDAQPAWDDGTAAHLPALLGAMEAELVTMAAERAGSPGGDPRSILLRVIDFESRFASIHAEYLARSVEPGVQGLFSALAMQDRHHMELLEQALQR
jgi:rubrerythrin